jgi:chromosome partitioning protein
VIIAPYREGVRQVVVVNPKGGCGKTTLATNLASYYTLRGSAVLLIDNDPIGYSSRWLERRPGNARLILGVTSKDARKKSHRFRPSLIPPEAETIIVDTPAALVSEQVERLTQNADFVLVPVIPSAFDVHAVTRFVAELLIITQFETPVGVVANRTRENSTSLSTLLTTLASFDTPTIAVLRNSQNYVSAAELGLGLYEMPEHAVRKDLRQMDRIVDWLEQRPVEDGLSAPHHPDHQSSASTRGLFKTTAFKLRQ